MIYCFKQCRHSDQRTEGATHKIQYNQYPTPTHAANFTNEVKDCLPSLSAMQNIFPSPIVTSPRQAHIRPLKDSAL